MSHERSHDRARLAARNPGRSEIDRLVKAIRPHVSGGFHAPQIFAGLAGCNDKGQHRRVGRNDQILGQAAFESQARHAERAVLVTEVRIRDIVAALGHAPGNAALDAVLDLPIHGSFAGLVEQCPIVSRHYQRRHQVLEHRAAPGQQHGLAADRGEQAPQRKPMILRQLSLCDRDEAAQPRFGRQQIIKAGIAPALVDVVSDGEQISRSVVEEVVVDFAEVTGLQHEIVSFSHPFTGAVACRCDCFAKLDDPIDDLGIETRTTGTIVQDPLDGGQQRDVNPRQLAKRRNAVELGQRLA